MDDDDEAIATAALEVDVDDNNEAAAAEREHCFRMGVPNGRMSMIASQNESCVNEYQCHRR